METLSDVQALREKGVRIIHSANQGFKDLVSGGPMVAMSIAMEANGSHEFSTKLSRRISHARKDAATIGKRSGGDAPFGLQNDGQGGLIPGDLQEIKIVRWIYDQFVNKLKAINWINSELNHRGIKASHGGRWWANTIRDLLMRPAYVSDFVYNKNAKGQFHIIDKQKEVVAVSSYDPDKRPKGGLFQKRNVWKGIVSRKLWSAAQERIKSFDGGARRPRSDGYPLSGVLVCGHCGGPMYGFRSGLPLLDNRQEGERILSGLRD